MRVGFKMCRLLKQRFPARQSRTGKRFGGWHPQAPLPVLPIGEAVTCLHAKPQALLQMLPIRRSVVFLLRFYQKLISPTLPPACRFYPSCSEYCILSVQQYGTLRGLYKCARRLSRCHPYHPGGVDFP